MNPAKPFIKWAGGKGKLLPEIRKSYPKDLGGRINKYAEPFVGGGAVLFDILNTFNMKEIYISDINRELINTYKVIRDDVTPLIEVLSDFQAKYITANAATRKSIYYNSRERYNHLKSSDYDPVELAALFIFLNRTCFNGLYRVNAKGGFNVPQGDYKNPQICDEENLQAVSAKLQNVIITHGDYTLSENFIDSKTFAYFDPPYRPLSTTANFTSYTTANFNDTDQTNLADFINKMSEQGAHITASNSDPKNTNENDNFFDNLYTKHKITRIQAARAINSNAAKRGKINELLITSG